MYVACRSGDTLARSYRMVVRGSAWDAASWTACDERVSQRVRPDLHGQPGASGDATDDPSGSVPVEPLAGWGEEDRSFA